MTDPDCPQIHPGVELRPVRSRGHDVATNAGERLRFIVDRHYDFLWRTLRHMGVPDANAEDAVQQVLCVLARRLGQVAKGAETSFLFSTAMRVASEARRAARRRPVSSDDDVDTLSAQVPPADELVDQRRAVLLLREVLDTLPEDMRIVFVLFEIQELTIEQIANLMEIPEGTAASRLRRGRERFQASVRRVQAARGRETSGGSPK